MKVVPSLLGHLSAVSIHAPKQLAMFDPKPPTRQPCLRASQAAGVLAPQKRTQQGDVAGPVPDTPTSADSNEGKRTGDPRTRAKAKAPATIATNNASGIAVIKQSPIEVGMAKHGVAVLGVLAAGVGCIPDPLGISSAVSNVLSLMQQRADGAVSNTNNCKKLLEAADWSQQCLAEVQAALSSERLADAGRRALDEQLQALEVALRDACSFLAEFGDKTFFGRLVSLLGGREGGRVREGGRERGREGGLSLRKLTARPRQS